MPKATKKHTTTKGKRPAPKKASSGSEIIKLCVAYLQATAGFEAGHKADTGEIAGDLLGSILLRKAEGALDTMVSLRSKTDKSPLTATELGSMAATCKAALDFDAGGCITKETGAFVRLFASEANAYLESLAEEEYKAVLAERRAAAASQSKAAA
jgi:hypothetical protein